MAAMVRGMTLEVTKKAVFRSIIGDISRSLIIIYKIRIILSGGES